MSEMTPKSNAQEIGNELVSTGEQVMTELISQRARLQANVEEIDNKADGFKLNAVEMMHRRQARHQAQKELDELGIVWSELGGDNIDAATERMNALSFNSDATERVRVHADLSQAKRDFIENAAQLDKPSEAIETVDEAPVDAEKLESDTESLSEISHYESDTPFGSLSGPVDSIEDIEPEVSDIQPVTLSKNSDPVQPIIMGRSDITVETDSEPQLTGPVDDINELTPSWKDSLRHPGAWLASRMMVAAAQLRALKEEKWDNLDNADKTKRKRIVMGVLGTTGLVAVGLAAWKMNQDPSSVMASHGFGYDPTTASSVDATAAPVMPSAGGHSQAAEQLFSSDALTIRKGEGFYQTFKELGIPKDQWNEKMAEVGPKLVKRGLAYHDQSGGYGWSSPMTVGADQLKDILRS